MKFFKAVAWFKNFLGRAGSWMTIINFFMLFFVFKSQYRIPIPAWAVVVFGTLGFIIVGVVDHRYVMPHQLSHQNSQNNMMHAIKRIEARINELSSEKSN